MNPTPRSLAILALLAAAPVALAAQEERPRGKIDEVEREARGDDRSDSGGDHWWAVELVGDVFKAIFATPKEPGQGYLPYPYAGDGALESFVLTEVQRGRRFGNLSIGRFDDASSTLRGTLLSFEGANDALRYTLEWSHYREPKPNEVDRLSDFRAGIGAAARLGRVGYVPVGVGARVVCLDDGTCAGGGDFELGARLFPVRPIGLSATFRIGGMSWTGGSTFLVTQSQTAVSAFFGRMEISAGWHWLKLGSASAFAGPTFASRIWL